MSKGTQAVAAGAAIASTAMASQVAEGAKKHWLWSAIGFGALFGVVTQADSWLNCTERTFRQAGLLQLRLAHAINAGHLATCAEKANEKALRVAKAVAIVAIKSQGFAQSDEAELVARIRGGTLLETGVALREAHAKTMDAGPLTSTDGGQPTARDGGPTANDGGRTATDGGIRDSLDGGSANSVDGGRPSMAEKRANLEKAAEVVAAATESPRAADLPQTQPDAGFGDLVPTAAECIEHSLDGGAMDFDGDRLWDRVNHELVLCQTLRQTSYGAFTATPTP